MSEENRIESEADEGVAEALDELAEMKESDPEAYEAMLAELREPDEAPDAFTPEQQAKVDEIVRSRIAREREKWEKANPLRGDLEQTAEELQQARKEAEETKRRAFEIAREREFNRTLERMQADPRRRDTLRKLVDLEGVEAADDRGLIPDRRQIERIVTETFNTMPEAFGERARSLRVNAPSTTPAGEAGVGSFWRGRLGKEQLEAMTPEEINSQWDRVAASLESMPASPEQPTPRQARGPSEE